MRNPRDDDPGLHDHPKSKSISDDDKCAECRWLDYRPGDMSLCTKLTTEGEWPAIFNEDGYCVDCAEFLTQSTVYASFAKLQEIVDKKNALCFVWRDEGTFCSKGWVFNMKHRKVGFEPLLVDLMTADLLITVHGKIEKPENRAKFERMVKSGRGSFGALVEFCWSRVSGVPQPKGG